MKFCRLLTATALIMLGPVLTSPKAMAATGPSVITISSRGNPNGITINWSKSVSATGTNSANYKLSNGVGVSAARYAAPILSSSSQPPR